MAKRASAPPAPGLDPVLDFMQLLWRIEHSLQATSKQMEAQLGITGPQRLVLKIVSQFPDISPGDLSRVVHLHPSTITGVVQRLVDKGLLERDRDRQDTRRMHLRLRPRGLPFTRRAAGTVEAAVAGALDRAASAHVKHARRVLQSIADALDG